MMLLAFIMCRSARGVCHSSREGGANLAVLEDASMSQKEIGHALSPGFILELAANALARIRLSPRSAQKTLLLRLAIH